ncbi:MAG: VWA domain-containing protein [Chloroflexi bacterium]|nr:VWA domain-containing protein [Chloroflexota bacterium]
MSFAWPIMLLSLTLVPVLVAGYVLLLQRREKRAAELGTMRLAQAGTARRLGWRRHVPPGVFLVAIALLLAALARPEVAGFPHREGTVILAFDVSSSMRADDLKPSRMAAAKEAATRFVENQPSTIQIGVVAFADGALVVQQPTAVKADVLAAVERLSSEGGTSLGEGIMTSLGAISGKPILLEQAALEGDLESVDIGYFGSAVIILLSDGENTSRFDPLIAAQIGGNAGVRVFTIGIGSADGATVEIDGFRVATALNEPLLQEIATNTSATYFVAEDAATLVEIYDNIDLRLTVEGDPMEVTSLAAAAAVLLLIVGGALTMRWFGRVP